MTLNIDISMNLVSLIQTVLIKKTFFYIEMTTLAIVLQCLSWPNKANIRIGVSFFYYSFILVFFKQKRQQIVTSMDVFFYIYRITFKQFCQ